MLLGSLLLAAPALAQNRHPGDQPSRPTTRGTRTNPTQRGPADWGAFRHNEAPARIAPRRYGNTNLPRPNQWRGNVQSFDSRRWQSGGWRHESHNGRFGWWWVIGPNWYFSNRPVYPYPDIYTPPAEMFGWWYWCSPYQEYYPYVTTCPVPWQRVLPRD